MDKLKISEWGEKLKTGRAQMNRIVSDKVKDILQAPTLESKMVDEATLETFEESNWGMSMRICAQINNHEFNASKLLEPSRKIFSEVVFERILDEMALLVKNSEAESENRRRAFQFIRAWGQSQNLNYLPVFQQTYMASGDDDGLLDYNFGNLSIKDKKEQIEITRNSLELLSSMLSTEGKPNHTEDELTVSLMDKCKQLQSLIQMIIESTTDDEGVLFEALHVNDELTRVLSIYELADESDEKASMVEQESSGSKDAHPKPTEEEEKRYPVPNQEQASGDDDGLLDYNFGNLSIKDKKEQIEITRNSLELLSSMLSTEGKPNHTEDELTVSLMDKCKQLQSLIQMIIESTTDDEGVLFEALHVNDELTRVLSIYELADESDEKASMVEQESSGSKDAHPKPTEEEEKRFVMKQNHVENSESSDKTAKEDKKVKIELGLSSDEDEK
ncbi:hypothetical protein HID58_037578 [Brassica napus]|uniref:GAT domain-containing protein n=1 Tax=Brassica napus TaxID=3708 RepID=A0ABQ8BNI1_BRANA|nr:hypothetical protein HID58_037578 [Brassica napus]